MPLERHFPALAYLDRLPHRFFRGCLHFFDTGVAFTKEGNHEEAAMAPKAWLTIATSALIVTAGGSFGSGGNAVAQQELAGFDVVSRRAPGRPNCTEATIRGTYGIQMQGTNPVPPALGGGSQTVIGVVIRTYDGVGAFTQVDNVKGSVTGIVTDRPGSGTYQVNEDCTAVTLFQPGPGITLEERMVIVDKGHEIRTIVSSPQSVMVSSVQKRIDSR
jgi:hypothetical protein